MNKSIEENLLVIFKKYSKQSWSAGLSAFLVGYLSNIFILTNELFNHDDIGALYQESSLVSARWLQSVFGKLVSPLGSGVMAGSLTILILAVSALLLVDTLKIQSKALSSIIGIMMVASPIVACFMSYLNGSYRFVVGIPFAIFAARWFDKGIKGILISSLSIMCAIAGYQSNLAITVALMYIILFVRLMNSDEKMSNWWISFGKASVSMLLGLTLFVLSNHVTVAILGNDTLSGDTQGYSMGITANELTSHGYEGQAETGTLYLQEIPQTVITSVKYFVKYHFNIFFGGPNISFASKINTFSSFILLCVMGISVFVSMIHQKNIWKKILIPIIFLTAPLFMNFTEILLNGKCTESLQMMYSMIMVVPLLVVVVESNRHMKTAGRNICMNVLFIALIIHSYGNIQLINDSYLRMNSIYETAYGEMNRIMDRVEQLPEWQDGNRKLYFDFGEEGGYLINENYQAFTTVDNYIETGWMGIFGTGVYKFWDNNNASNFVLCYLGVDFERPTAEEIEEIKNDELYETLSMFPSTDSVKVISNIVVVRLDE